METKYKVGDIIISYGRDIYYILNMRYLNYYLVRLDSDYFFHVCDTIHNIDNCEHITLYTSAFREELT